MTNALVEGGGLGAGGSDGIPSAGGGGILTGMRLRGDGPSYGNVGLKSGCKGGGRQLETRLRGNVWHVQTGWRAVRGREELLVTQRVVGGPWSKEAGQVRHGPAGNLNAVRVRAIIVGVRGRVGNMRESLALSDLV